MDWILNHYLDIPIIAKENVGILGIIDVNIYWNKVYSLKKSINVDEKELAKLVSVVELQIIKNVIKNTEQKYNPKIRDMDINRYNNFNSDINKWLNNNRFEANKMNLAEHITDFYGKSVNKLTDTQIFLWINNKKNKKT
jgi:hypothetical protein